MNVARGVTRIYYLLWGAWALFISCLMIAELYEHWAGCSYNLARDRECLLQGLWYIVMWGAIAIVFPMVLLRLIRWIARGFSA